MLLQRIRERLTGMLAVVFLGVLIVPFAFVGVNEYLSAGSGNQVALVNEEEITSEAFNQSFINYRRQMQQRLGDSFDPSDYDSTVARLEHLDRMIDEELLRQAAESLEFAVDDERLAQTIRDIPAFQVDGAFNADVYQARVAAMGMSVPQFESQLRQSAAVSTLPQAISSSSFATDREYREFVALTEQTRDFQALTVPSDVASVPETLPEEQLRAWYEDNQGRFQTEEQVTIEFLEIDGSVLPEGELPSDEDLRAAYEAQKGRFITPERRRVSHILIEAPASAPQGEIEAARLQAEAIAAQALSGEDFATLAEASSEDIGSASLGGDLGFLEPGIMAESFEAAAFELTLDEPISDPVQTGFGWHIIKLTDIEPSSGMSFEEAREVLLEEARESTAERAFLDLADRLVDIVYEDPTTLEAASLDLGLEIKTEGPFTRAGGQGIASNPDVVEAAFSELVLLQDSASDLIDLGPTDAVVIRVLEHEPVRTQSFEEVRDAVEQGVREELAMTRARERAEALKARIEAGEALEAVAEAEGLNLETVEAADRRSLAPDPVVVQNVFKLPRPENDSPALHVIEGMTGYSLVALQSVTDGEVADDAPLASRQARAMMGTINASVESWALVRQLRERADVQIFEDNLGGSR
ncbi:MAG: SurA N-terminal domain-containing protein [Xanthomonadales bacterium]|jgi:peptidyl-prolyl cis-trans isomerase D|nr:SurA N-terminal domain-containing protein [Xanthomonadales bacterium]